MKKVLLSLIFCFYLLFVEGQVDSNYIKGSVIGIDKLPVTAGTVLLMKVRDSSLVKATLTDHMGRFSFNKPQPGKYFIQISAVGWQSYNTGVIQVDLLQSVYSFEPIILSPQSKSLDQVKITTKRPLIEMKIDKTVVNVESFLTNTGSSALEVLEKSPGVSVDDNGNISLQGKAGVLVMMDGKPTYLSSSDLTNLLRNIPASSLDQIEIIINPSARYDASGNSGIINIKTKKNKNQGFNGSISTDVSVGFYFKSNSSIVMNWRKGKINLFGNYSYSNWANFNDTHTELNSRNDRFTAFNRYMEQHTFEKVIVIPQNYKAGLDFFATKKNTLGFLITGNMRDLMSHSSSLSDFFDSTHSFVQYNNAVSQRHSDWSNMGLNLNYVHQFDSKGSELSLDADNVTYRINENQSADNYLFNADNSFSGDPYLQDAYLPGHITIRSLRADFRWALKNNATLEAGVKTSSVRNDNDAEFTRYDAQMQKWEIDTTFSNHFVYTENINAAYINFQQQLKKLAFQFGLRAEKTLALGNQLTKLLSFKKDYIDLFPTAYLSYKLNEDHILGLSLGRRIDRPGYQSLNPFRYQYNRYTYQTGNPNLQPQFSNNLIVSYNYKGQLNISATYSVTSNIISTVIITSRQTGDDNYTTHWISENIASSRNAGFSFSYNRHVKKWWTLNFFANVFNNRYKGVVNNESQESSLTTFMANASSQFNLNKGWNTELSGMFNSKRLFSINIIGYPTGMFSLGVGKEVMNKKGSLRLSLRDPLKILSSKSLSDLSKGIQYAQRYWDNRSMTLAFTYRFGKVLQERKRNSAADEEMRRVN